MASKSSRRTATQLTREQCVRFGRIEAIDPSTRPEAKEGHTHVYFHPESQRTLYLGFTDDGLTAYRSADGGRLSQRRTAPTAP